MRQQVGAGTGLHEPVEKGLALDRGSNLDRVWIFLVREHGAFRIQYEAKLNPMQRLGVARARSDGGGVVDDDPPGFSCS